MIKIHNKGKDIESTNYWGSESAAAGGFYLTCNAGHVRLLVPGSKLSAVSEMKSAQMVVITSGVFKGLDMHEIMFDDGSDAPYTIMITQSASDGRLSDQDTGKVFEFSVWSRAGKQLELKGGYRKGENLPCLDPWGFFEDKPH